MSCPVFRACLDLIVLIIFLLYVAVLRTETYLISFLSIFGFDNKIMVIHINVAVLTEIALGYSASLSKVACRSSCFVTSTAIRLLVGVVANTAAGMYKTKT